MKFRHALPLGLAAACSPSAAQISAPKATTPPEPPTTATTAPPVAEPPTTTTAAPTATTTLVVLPTVPPTTLVLPEQQPELDDRGWWDREALLNCIRSYEQGADGYATNTGNGYHGAFQFDQGTWDGVVGRAGYPEWVGRRAGDAPPFVQDDAAWLLYTERGLAPWPTPQRLC